jgi:hypothetical protein
MRNNADHQTVYRQAQTVHPLPIHQAKRAQSTEYQTQNVNSRVHGRQICDPQGAGAVDQDGGARALATQMS